MRNPYSPSCLGNKEQPRGNKEKQLKNKKHIFVLLFARPFRPAGPSDKPGDPSLDRHLPKKKKEKLHPCIETLNSRNSGLI